MRLIALILIVGIFTACTASNSSEIETNPEVYKIFTVDEAEAMAFLSWMNVESYWTVTPTDVDKLQSELLQYLEAEEHNTILDKVEITGVYRLTVERTNRPLVHRLTIRFVVREYHTRLPV